jgi:hypothetical protein
MLNFVAALRDIGDFASISNHCHSLSLQSENEKNDKQINKLENLTEIDPWLQDLQSLEDSYTKNTKP